MADSTACGMDSDDFEAELESIVIDVRWPGGINRNVRFYHTQGGTPLTVAEALTGVMQRIGQGTVALENVTAAIMGTNGGDVTMIHGKQAMKYHQDLSADDSYLDLRF